MKAEPTTTAPDRHDAHSENTAGPAEQAEQQNGSACAGRAIPAELAQVLDADGAAGALVRDLDWSATPIGSPHGWPPSLRTALGICLASQLPIVIFWGPKLVTIYNDAYAALLGGKHPAAMGQPAEDVWTEVWDIVEPMLSAVMAGKGATYYQDAMLPMERHGYREECYVTVSNSPIRDDSGGIGGVFGTCTETTTQVVGARRLRTLRADAHYLHLLDDFPLLVWRSGIDAMCDYFNNTWLAFTGRTLQQELGDGWTEGVHPEDLEHCLSTYLNAFNERKPFEMEYRLRHADGDYRWVLDVGRPVFSLAGRFTGYIGSGLDLTERRRAEQAVRAAAVSEQSAAREHRIAAELQKSLLPTKIFAPDTVRTAVHYRAGGQETDIGGDWYDVIELGAGRAALVIGDVMGRGVRAAAVMGQLRAAVRAYARLDMPPADVLELLDGVVRDLTEDAIVTCIYAVYDPLDRSLAFASAGHLPPLLATPGGSVHRLTEGNGPPLGTNLPEFATQRVILPPGGILALYTDGLVEQRGRDIDTGIEALGRNLVGFSDTPLPELPDLLVEAMVPADQNDDIALLLVQVSPSLPPEAARPLLQMEIPDNRRAARHARAAVKSALDGCRIPPDRAADIILVASELVTNAVLHGGPAMDLTLRRTGDDLILDVHDGAITLPRRLRANPDDEHGRGIYLVSLLAGRWGARATERGKSVWCTFTINKS